MGVGAIQHIAPQTIGAIQHIAPQIVVMEKGMGIGAIQHIAPQLVVMEKDMGIGAIQHIAPQLVVKVTLGTRRKPRSSGRRVSWGVGPGLDVGSAAASSTRGPSVKNCSRMLQAQLGSSAATPSREL